MKQTPPTTEFNICPNAGISRPEWIWLMGGLVVVGIGIGARFALLGFWMILPFTLLELGLVYYLINRVQRGGRYTEKIHIDEETVRIQHLEADTDNEWQFPLHWVRVDLQSPEHQWYPHRLLLGASGNWVEVGSCLTDDERCSLAKAVRREIRRIKMGEPQNA